MKKKYKATIALAISVAGAAGTAGLAKAGFWGGMLHNGFLAATIGGMADWFAVTALFRKPLGISYRTEIIIRNRQRIMQAVVDFAGNDLLGTENVMRFVRQQDTALFLKEFLVKNGETMLLPAVDRMALQLQQGLSPKVLARELAPGLGDMLGRAQMDRLAADFLLGLSRPESAGHILHLLAAAAEELLEAEELRRLLARYADDVLTEYGDAAGGRAFLIGLMGLTGERIADGLLEKCKSFLKELAENPEAEAKAAAWLGERLSELAEKPAVVAGLTDSLGDFCTQEKLAGVLEPVLAEFLAGDRLTGWLHHMAEFAMRQFVASHQLQQQADALLKDWLEAELQGHHDVIAGMIEERLGRLSDEELVEFTEEKVADDLQMIRINGSVVGAIAGMALYAVIYAAGQVLGT
ncbi:MAG: DUF445 family protein [Anaerovibrio sp.]